jgi:8-oxo-dGTP pyrophosphatase MutT (NUDIX family)
MPKAVSRRQYRMMMAIAHGDVKDGPRGRPPKSVAAKYTDPGKDAPDQSGENRGGTWSDKHHEKHKDKEKKKDKKDLKKAFEDHYRGEAAAAIVLDSQGRILMGNHRHGGLAFPGGHMDNADLMDHATTALRELKEEAGVIGHNPNKIWEGKLEGNHCVVYLIESFRGKPSSSEELKNVRWIEPSEIEWNKVRNCCVTPLRHFLKWKLGKSLEGLLIEESLEKNIIRQKADAVFEVSHGDALRLVGNGMFRRLRKEVKDMKDEDFKDVTLDTYTLSIRKHMNDVYSGRVNDGHKQVFQFTNKSLPELTAALMSVFEWYMPEDQEALDLVDEANLPDDAIHGGLHNLIENYKRHNVGNIYEEMETIREQIRNGVAVDLQQVEAKILKLFDKLEEVVHTVSSKHNQLAGDAGREMDELERKLRELQNKLEEMEKKPEVVEAYSSNPANKDEVLDNFYPYLSKPRIEIMPSGKITIRFDSDWQNLEKENFLQDLRAKAIKKAGRANG